MWSYGGSYSLNMGNPSDSGRILLTNRNRPGKKPKMKNNPLDFVCQHKQYLEEKRARIAWKDLLTRCLLRRCAQISADNQALRDDV